MFLAALLKAHVQSDDDKSANDHQFHDALAPMDFTAEWPSFKPRTANHGAVDRSGANPSRSRWV